MGSPSRVEQEEPIGVALVVDDEPVTRRTLREELETQGFLVVEARDGAEGWTRFLKEDPELVVTDLRMPNEDGVALVRRIRREAKSWVPIIVITSQTDTGIIELVVEATRESATKVFHLQRDLDRLGDVARNLLAVSVPSLRDQKKQRDVQTILACLPESDGNISKLSRLTKIPRSSLYPKLREMNLLESMKG